MEGALAGVFLAMLVMASQTVFEEATAMATLPAYKEDSEHAAKRLTETVQTFDEQSSQPSGTLSVEHAVTMELSDVTFQYEGSGDRRSGMFPCTFYLAPKRRLSGRVGQENQQLSNCCSNCEHQRLEIYD